MIIHAWVVRGNSKLLAAHLSGCRARFPLVRAGDHQDLLAQPCWWHPLIVADEAEIQVALFDACGFVLLCIPLHPPAPLSIHGWVLFCIYNSPAAALVMPLIPHRCSRIPLLLLLALSTTATISAGSSLHP